jgi:hypothetical protein
VNLKLLTQTSFWHRGDLQVLKNLRPLRHGCTRSATGLAVRDGFFFLKKQSSPSLEIFITMVPQVSISIVST